jgi:hypothetical protein
VPYAAGHLLPLVLTMSRQHEVKNGIWLLEKMVIIRFILVPLLLATGLSNDQEMVNAADGNWKHNT